MNDDKNLYTAKNVLHRYLYLPIEDRNKNACCIATLNYNA